MDKVSIFKRIVKFTDVARPERTQRSKVMSQAESQTHGDEVFVFVERITPIEGRTEDVLAISRKSAKLLHDQPGMIQTMLTRSEKEGGEICTFTVWKAKTDFQAFMKTDEVATLLKSDDFKNIKSWMANYDMQMMEFVDGWHG